MVKRICIIFPDGSVSIMAGAADKAEPLNQARRECSLFNRGERDVNETASFGEIDVDLMSFKERC